MLKHADYDLMTTCIILNVVFIYAPLYKGIPYLTFFPMELPVYIRQQLSSNEQLRMYTLFYFI